MRIPAVNQAFPTFFDSCKRFVNDIEGIEKLGNIIMAIAGLVLLKNGSSPTFLETWSEHFSNYETFKNSFNWIRTGDGFFSNPYNFDIFSEKNISKKIKMTLNLVKRVCFLGIVILGTLEYCNKLNKFTPLASFPIKLCLLVATTILTNIVNGIELYENSKAMKKLKEKRILIINSQDPTVDRVRVNAKLAKMVAKIDQLKAQEKIYFDAAEKTPLNIAAKLWLEKISSLDVAEGDYLALKKRKMQLKLLEKPTLENLSNFRALYEMQTYEEFRTYKIEKQYNVREEKLKETRAKTWRSVASEIGRMGVFSLLVVNSPYLALVPIGYAYAFAVVQKTVSLVSGLIGAEKFLFESKSSQKKELQPFEVVVAVPN